VNHGLIFDLDGTLVDSLTGLAASLNRALSHSALPQHPVSNVRGFIGNGARVLVERAVPPASDEALISTVEHAFKADYEVTWPDGTVLYDGVPEMLEILQARGYPLAVLSNKPHPFTQAIVARLIPEIRFTAVLGQRPGISHKPDPAGALEIAAAFNLAVCDCRVIGDSTPDLETARNSGMRSVAVMWGFHERDRLLAAGPDFTVETPSELIALFP
jgi:phosphoglycolate phosphatase